MARTVTPLTDPKCEAAKSREKDYTLFDGQGLFLLVKATGTKVWRFKYKKPCLLYTSPSPRDQRGSRMPSSA